MQLCGLVEAGYADVYDLEVEDTHEFFANGILVHNCYRYGMKSMLAPKRKTQTDIFNEEMDALQAKGDIATLTLHNYIREKKKSAVKVNINHMHQRLPPSWRSNIANSGDSDE